MWVDVVEETRGYGSVSMNVAQTDVGNVTALALDNWSAHLPLPLVGDPARGGAIVIPLWDLR